MLNRSFLRGCTTVGPELASAVLTVLFYTINEKKKKIVHSQNKTTNLVYHPNIYLCEMEEESDEEVEQESDESILLRTQPEHRTHIILSYLENMIQNHRATLLSMISQNRKRDMYITDFLPSLDFLPDTTDDE